METIGSRDSGSLMTVATKRRGGRHPRGSAAAAQHLQITLSEGTVDGPNPA